MEDKKELLRDIDREIKEFQEQCLKAGYGPEFVCELSHPLVDMVWKDSIKQKSKKYSLIISLIVLLAAIAVGPAKSTVLFYIRQYLIMVLPLWKWTELYGRNCLITNPFYIGNSLVEEDCSLCESLDQITRVENITQTVATEVYLNGDVPFIVTDGMKDWPIMNTEEFWFDNITDLYLHTPGINNMRPCFLTTNVRIKRESLRAFLSLIHNPEQKRWFGHWENCFKAPAKALRQFYHRPYFVPSAVELAESNWVIMSSNYMAKVYKQIQSNSDLLIVAQLRGHNNIRVSPKEPCHRYCPELTDILNEGEMVVLTEFLWKFEYIPGLNSDNFAVAMSGYLD